MRRFKVLTIVALCLAVLACAALAAPNAIAADRIRVAVQRTGTLAWELEIIKAHGLDETANLRIETIELASTEAGKIALKGGAADLILSDWLWVARERSLGGTLVFYPSSSTLGAVMVPPQSPIKEIADLKGTKLAVAGGPLDKSWLLLQALARRSGLDLRRQASIVYGAPPLLSEKALQRETDATLTFWNFCADLESKGHRRAIAMDDVMRGLGTKGPVAIVGYTFDGGWASRNRFAVDRFLDAARQAKDILASSEAEWRQLAPRIGVRRRCARNLPAALRRRNRVAVQSPTKKLTRVLCIETPSRGRRRQLVGPARELDRGTFYRPGLEAMNPALQLVSLGLLVVAWYVGSQFAGARLLPDPYAVGLAILNEARSGALASTSAQPWHASPWRLSSR